MAATRRKLFISYSHKDARWLRPVREQLEVLEKTGALDIFEDSQIEAGAKWYDRLEQEMLQSDVALFLISATFLSSDFIRNEEVPRLLDRYKSAGAILYPLLLRDCAWQEVSWLREIQMRPQTARPVLSFKGAARDKCLADVAREIAYLLRERDTQTKLEVDTGEKASIPAGIIIGEGSWSARISLDPVISSVLGSGDGAWHSRVYLESMGPGPEFELPAEATPTAGEGPVMHDGWLEHEFHGNLPKGSIPPGMYKMVGTLEYTGSSGATPPLSYFAEGPIIQIQEA